jgi:FkbM family methyltransferase
LGARGILAVSTNLLFGSPTYLPVATDEAKHPLFVRLRTSDAELFRSVFLDREYHCPVAFSPRTIVDVGANCGMTSVFYANLYPDATIIAVEPESSNFAALVKNTRDYPNIIPVQAALWCGDGQVEVFPGWPLTENWGKWGFRVRNGIGCRALTLTTLMREYGIDTVDILKIDVEGAEREIFSSCDWVDRVKFLAIELHDHYWPGCSTAVNAIMSRHLKTERGSVTFYSQCSSQG